MSEWDEWEEEETQKTKKVSPKSLTVEPAIYDNGETVRPAGLNIAYVAYEHKGKSLLATLIGYWNKQWWTTSPAKEGAGIRRRGQGLLGRLGEVHQLWAL